MGGFLRVGVAHHTSGAPAGRRSRDPWTHPPKIWHLSWVTVKTSTIPVKTRGHTDVVDLTAQVEGVVQQCGLKQGTVTLFVTGSTASLSTIEYEPGAVKDIGEILESIAPERADYHHHGTWGDDNGSSHARACLMGPSLTIPFSDGKPLLGTWQQVVLLDFDTRPREREIVAQVMGE